MRKAFVTAAIAATLAGMAIGPPSSLASTRQEHSRPKDWRQEQCRFATRDGVPGVSTYEARAMLRCAEAHWSGNLDLGMRIVGCESGFRAQARNARSSAAGLWQSLDSTWRSWYANQSSVVRRFELKDNPTNGRASAILGWRVFVFGGTGPWESSRSCWG